MLAQSHPLCSLIIRKKKFCCLFLIFVCCFCCSGCRGDLLVMRTLLWTELWEYGSNSIRRCVGPQQQQHKNNNNNNNTTTTTQQQALGRNVLWLVSTSLYWYNIIYTVCSNYLYCSNKTLQQANNNSNNDKNITNKQTTIIIAQTKNITNNQTTI